MRKKGVIQMYMAFNFVGKSKKNMLVEKKSSKLFFRYIHCAYQFVYLIDVSLFGNAI